MIKRKGFFLNAITNPKRNITIYPHVYMGWPYWNDPEDPYFQPLLRREKAYLDRQGDQGLIVWFLKWCISSKFRMEEAALAYASELSIVHEPWDRERRVYKYAMEMTGPLYFNAAPNKETAILAIEKYLGWVGND